MVYSLSHCHFIVLLTKQLIQEGGDDALLFWLSRALLQTQPQCRRQQVAQLPTVQYQQYLLPWPNLIWRTCSAVQLPPAAVRLLQCKSSQHRLLSAATRLLPLMLLMEQHQQCRQHHKHHRRRRHLRHQRQLLGLLPVRLLVLVLVPPTESQLLLLLTMLGVATVPAVQAAAEQSQAHRVRSSSSTGSSSSSSGRRHLLAVRLKRLLAASLPLLQSSATRLACRGVVLLQAVAVGCTVQAVGTVMVAKQAVVLVARVGVVCSSL